MDAGVEVIVVEIVPQNLAHNDPNQIRNINDVSIKDYETHKQLELNEGRACICIP